MLIWPMVGYTSRTSLTHSSTIPATLFYGSSSPGGTRFLRELGADSDVWDPVRWPSRKPTFEELYWLAGLFEGEGSFDPGQVRITQKEREIIDQMRRPVGGRVARYVNKTGLNGPAPMYVWYASGPRGRRIARTLYHLPSTRRKAQARAFLRISRVEEPPPIDLADPARLLWDRAPQDDLDPFE